MPRIPASTRILRRLERVYARLEPHLLATGDERELCDGDFSPSTVHPGPGDAAPASELLFGTYSRQGLERALRDYGSLERLAARGVGPVETRVELSDPYRPHLCLYSTRYQAPVVDLVFSRSRGKAAGLPPALADVPLLGVDWIELRHPGRAFDWTRPPLPGQQAPGLSAATEVLALLLLMARRVEAEGIVLTAKAFHTVCIYQRFFLAVDGEAQGVHDAVHRAARFLPLWLLAWAVEEGCLREDAAPRGAGAPGEEEGAGTFRHHPLCMISPLSPRLRAYFESPAYEDAAGRGRERRFTLDAGRLAAQFPWDRMPGPVPPPRVRALFSALTSHG